MACSSLVLTQLGSDALNGAAGPLSASWTSPIETGHAIVLNGTSAYGNGTVGGEAEYIGVVVPQDQYAEKHQSGHHVQSNHKPASRRMDTAAGTSQFVWLRQVTSHKPDYRAPAS